MDEAESLYVENSETGGRIRASASAHELKVIHIHIGSSKTARQFSFLAHLTATYTQMKGLMKRRPARAPADATLQKKGFSSQVAQRGEVR